jgi:hypothetical protein
MLKPVPKKLALAPLTPIEAPVSKLSPTAIKNYGYKKKHKKN